MNVPSITSASTAWQLPRITGENATYNDEGTTTTGWTLTAGTLSQPTASTVRLTMTTLNTQAISQRTITMPNANKDWLIYGSVRCRASAGDAGIIQLRGTGNLRANLYFNFSATSNTSQPGTVSVRYVNSGGTATNGPNITGFSTATTAVNFLLAFNSSQNSLTVYLRQTDGSWVFGGRCACIYFAGDLAFSVNSSTDNAGWIEFDYLTVCKPNFIAIGDSIIQGSTLFSEELASGLTNYESTLMKHAGIYPSLRNNFILNKGVGGESSTQINARLSADVITNTPQLCFLECSTNDYGLALSYATRNANIQSSVSALVAANIKAVLLNSLYGATTAAGNPTARRDYYWNWWQQQLSGITGTSARIDIMSRVRDSSGFLNTSYVQGDGIHPNVTGYTHIGKYIARQVS